MEGELIWLTAVEVDGVLHVLDAKGCFRTRISREDAEPCSAALSAAYQIRSKQRMLYCDESAPVGLSGDQATWMPLLAAQANRELDAGLGCKANQEEWKWKCSVLASAARKRAKGLRASRVRGRQPNGRTHKSVKWKTAIKRMCDSGHNKHWMFGTDEGRWYKWTWNKAANSRRRVEG